MSSHTNVINLLSKQGSWANLCVPAAVPLLNGVVRTLRLADLRDKRKLADYLSEIILLHHGSGVILDKYFERRSLTETETIYFLGDEKRPEVLHALCHDPVMTRDQDRIAIEANVLLGNGSVERWTFHLRAGRTVRVEAVDRVRVRRKDSFAYPLLQG